MQNTIEKFLTAIWKVGEVREVRAFDASGYPYFGYFDSPEKAAKAIEKIYQSFIVYITLNPCEKLLLARAANRIKKFSKLKKDSTTSDDNIVELKILLIDCDPETPIKGISSTKEELEQTKRLAEQVILEIGSPFVYGMSGNGHHLLYWHDAKDPQQLKEYLNKLADKLDNAGAKIDRTVYNPSRITKVLGTWARKGDPIDERPHRQSKVIEVNSNSKILSIPPVPEKTAEPKKITTQRTEIFPKNGNGQNHFDVRQFLTTHGIMVKSEKAWKGCTMLVLDECVFDSNHKAGEAAVVIHPDGKLSYQCFHNSCKAKPNTWSDLRQRLGSPKAEPTCKQCQQVILWDNRIPLNADGSDHRKTCPANPNPRKLEISFSAEDQKAIADQERTITEPQKIEIELDKPDKPKTIQLELSKIHETFGYYWKNFEGKTETCKEYVLASFLVSLGCTLGNKVMLRTDRGIRPNMYCVLLGSSTFMKKTTGMDLGTMPISELSEVARKKYELEIQEWNTKKEDAFDRKEKFTDPKPADQSLIYSPELTPEMLLEKMQGKSDGMFVYSEMASLLARLNQSYMSGFKERLTDFFDGRSKPYRRETKSGGTITIENPAPSFLAASTIEWLQAHLQAADLLSGFLARFLFVSRSEYSEIDVPIPPYWELDETWKRLFEKMSTYKGSLTLSQEAANAYSKWYTTFKRWAISQDKFVHSFLGRLQTYCHKIAIVNHFLDCDLAVTDGLQITAKSYELSFHWIDFFAQNILACYGDLTKGHDLNEDKALEIIRLRGDKGRVANHILCKYLNMKAKDVKELMDTLQEKNFVQKVTQGKRVFWKIAAV